MYLSAGTTPPHYHVLVRHRHIITCWYDTATSCAGTTPPYYHVLVRHATLSCDGTTPLHYHVLVTNQHLISLIFYLDTPRVSSGPTNWWTVPCLAIPPPISIPRIPKCSGTQMVGGNVVQHLVALSYQTVSTPHSSSVSIWKLYLSIRNSTTQSTNQPSNQPHAVASSSKSEPSLS
jgi:hypothetical protein